MIQFVHGSIFRSQMQTLVNTVNCVGVMGKGIARIFRDKYPAMYNDYQQQCEKGNIKPGVLSLYTDTKPWIINFPTKRHWRAKSRIEDIEAGLQTLVVSYHDWGITSIALPALGCGNGGLDWSQVRPLMQKHLDSLNIMVEVYEPTFAVEMKDSQPQPTPITFDQPSSEIWQQPSLFD